MEKESRGGLDARPDRPTQKVSTRAEPARPRVGGDRAEQFCPHCEISTDLHSGIGDDIEEWECETAAMKVDTMNRFFGIAFR